MSKKPIIDPKAVLLYEEKIAQELLRFVPGPNPPDDIDVKDARALAPLLKKFDWVHIQRFGEWLFSDIGWTTTSLKLRNGKKFKEPSQPSNATLGILRQRLRNLEDDEALGDVPKTHRQTKP